MTAINVELDNPFFSSLDGVLFNKSQTQLLEYPTGKGGDYVIPNTVTNIADEAFNRCLHLGTVTIPSSVTKIGNDAFYYCTLSNVVISSGVSQIWGNSFAECPNLTSVTIPGTVTFIWAYSFSYCSNLTHVYFTGNPPTGDGSLFLGDKLTVYYLPGTLGWGSMFAGQPAVLWNPSVHVTDALFATRTNNFSFAITGTANIPVRIDACANLESPAWAALQTCTLTNGSIYFNDPQTLNLPARFYRIAGP